MGSTVLDPGEEVSVNDTVEVDICEYTTFSTTTDVISDKSSNCTPCIDTAEYTWKLDKICELYVGITCEKRIGIPIDWNDIPPDKTNDDCTVYVK